jgi:hypothetical protein
MFRLRPWRRRLDAATLFLAASNALDAGRAEGLHSLEETNMMKTLVVGALAGLLTLGAGRRALAAGGDEQTLKGTWLVEVTLRDCATQAPRPSFHSLLSFDGAGTLIETTNNPGFLPGQRGPGHGVWTRTGSRTFNASSDAFIQFSSAPNPPASPGFTRGIQRIAQTITMAKGQPDEFNSEASVQFFDLSGTQLLAACATAIGHRY